MKEYNHGNVIGSKCYIYDCTFPIVPAKCKMEMEIMVCESSKRPTNLFEMEIYVLFLLTDEHFTSVLNSKLLTQTHILYSVKVGCVCYAQHTGVARVSVVSFTSIRYRIHVAYRM